MTSTDSLAELQAVHPDTASDRGDAPVGPSLIALLIVLLLCGGLAFVRARYNDHVAVCTIRDKDRGGSDGSYRVYTEQCGVIGNYDQWLNGKSNSADLQSRLQVGHTYMLRIAGWRFSPMSEFPNVVAIKGEITR